LVYLQIISTIAALGLSVTETHERLAKVEKAVEQLSRRIK
ncbi:unnamed protein product, partial [marine sediment metagenome]